MKKWSVFLVVILLISSSLVGCSKQAQVPTPDHSITVTAEAAKPVIASKDGQRMAKITIKEASPGSLTPNGTITFVLPAGTRFSSDPTLSLVAGSGIWATAATTPTADNREATFTMSATASATTPAELELANVDIDIAPNLSGDIKIEVKGSAGATGQLIVVNCAKLISLNSAPAPVGIGAQNQSAGDMIITEGAPGAIASSEGHNRIQLIAPAGVTFSSIPKAEVTVGNLQIGTVSLSSDNRTILIATAYSSTVASTITVSGIKLTVNRTVPEGDVTVTVSGPALMQNDPGHFPNTTDAGRVVIAKVNTPAPTNRSYTSVFTVGAANYTVNGVSKTMDIAPYLQNNRILVPLRYAADALAISDSGIIWDDVNQTTTLIKGNQVVQVKIGSATMLINSVPVTMDVTPQMVNQRVIIDLSWIAQALGATMTWNEAAQTATLSF